jgi:hypothetical protein
MIQSLPRERADAMWDLLEFLGALLAGCADAGLLDLLLEGGERLIRTIWHATDETREPRDPSGGV